MELSPDKLIMPISNLIKQAHQVGRAAIDSLDSQRLAANLIDKQEQQEIVEATALKGVGEFISKPEMVTHQAKIIAHLTVRGIVRRSNQGEEVCDEDVDKLKNVMQDLPPEQSLETLELQEEEVAEIRHYL